MLRGMRLSSPVLLLPGKPLTPMMSPTRITRSTSQLLPLLLDSLLLSTDSPTAASSAPCHSFLLHMTCTLLSMPRRSKNTSLPLATRLAVTRPASCTVTEDRRDEAGMEA